MLTPQEQSALRSRIFRHLDGLVTAPVAQSFHARGVLKHLMQHRQAEVGELAQHFKANEGYLNVGLRVLASQGWLNYHIDHAANQVHYSINHKSEQAFELVPLYEKPVELLRYAAQFHPRKFDARPFASWRQLFQDFAQSFHLHPAADKQLEELQQQVLAHIEGVLAGPSIVSLGMGGMFHKYFMQASFRADEYHEDAENFEILLDFFAHLGWFVKKNDTYRFTEKGLFFARRASAYGVTVSYLPTLRNADELMFGNPHALRSAPGEPEKHVDREMNVWGSGGAHATYFSKVDDIIIDLFSRPIDQQPRGVLDMGCGNGAFIQHIFEVIEQRTPRGRQLDQYPLLLIGADYNKAALNVTRANLIKADIWAKVVWGDISDPDGLAAQLREDYDIELKDLLNVRTFLDHNRIWSEPLTAPLHTGMSTGAFASGGQRLNNAVVEQNLQEHFQKWTPYLERFGLVVIELHTLPPDMTSGNLGRTAATAYDATHGFSDQYIVEAPVFFQVVERAGLKRQDDLYARFPDSDLATVTVSLLKGN